MMQLQIQNKQNAISPLFNKQLITVVIYRESPNKEQIIANTLSLFSSIKSVQYFFVNGKQRPK
jgi:hypothetical protein